MLLISFHKLHFIYRKVSINNFTLIYSIIKVTKTHLIYEKIHLTELFTFLESWICCAAP